MQGNNNFIRVYKQKDKAGVRHDPKRNKNRLRDFIRKARRNKSKETEND